MSMMRVLAVALALMLCALAQPASAEWRKVETPRFIIYSDSDARTLTEAAQELELYDSTLRFLHGVDPSRPALRKLSIYLVRDTAALRQVMPGASTIIRGFYTASDDDIYAVAIRERRNMRTLLHEYAHHFMLENFASGYPAWLVEGYAEYFATADLNNRQITIGLADPNRQAWLGNASWLPLRDVLTRRPSSFRSGEEVAQFYAQSWMLTHWFMASPTRTRQLVVYADNLQAGMEPVAALEGAVGMTLADLERTQRAYAGQRLALKRFSADQFAAPTMEMTTLSSGEADLLLLNLRLSRYLTDEEAPRVLGQIRGLAGRHPADLFAQGVLARAEIEYGDPQAAESAMQLRLESAPDDLTALTLLARLRMKTAEDAEDGAALGEARNYLARAYAVDPERYQTLYALARVRQTAPDYPTDNDMLRILIAYDVAPQVASVRFAAAQAHLMRQEYDAGIRLLEPLAGNPHDDGAAAAARALIDQVRALQEEEFQSGTEVTVRVRAEAVPATGE